jgi:membrane-associated phospholipid phosphatase
MPPFLSTIRVSRRAPTDADGLGARRRLCALPPLALALVAAALLGSSPVRAQTPSTGPEPSTESSSGLGSDIKAYLTAPLHAGRPQWVAFGAVVGAVAFAHHYDEDVRNHLGPGPEIPAEPPDTHDASDAVPAALLLAGTYVAALTLDDNDGRHEAGAMLEAAALSSAAGYVLKAAAGRERPYVSADPDNWRTGGDSFPSLHTTAAFAIGTVLAESGNGRYRWIRRVLGYGIAAGTAYARINHDAHWFSDTVAGAGLGVATARFVMKRHEDTDKRGQLQLTPTPAGIELSYTVALRR